MGKRIPYEELIQREEELTKQQNEILQQVSRLRSEKNKITSKLGSLRRLKLKYFIEKMNKCLSDKSFTIVRLERLYSAFGCAAVTCTAATVSHYVWFHCQNGCSIEDVLKEDVKVEIFKNDAGQFEMNIYPLGVGGKCLAAV